MDRRTFLTGSLAVAGAFSLPRAARAAQATPNASDLRALKLTLSDTGFEIAQPIQAGRYEVTVSNTGTSTESHFGLGKIPDDITDTQYEEWLNSPEGETEALSFEDIAFVGVPDWPQPGGSVSGVIDLAPGRYLLFDPITGRTPQTLTIEGTFAAGTEPHADLTVGLRDMAIDLPEAAFTSEAVRWKIENTGAMSHEVAVVAVPPDFTAEHLLLLAGLPFDATPPPDVPELVYQPVAAIGILGKQQTCWLDVQLAPGRYMGVCMLPFSTGYPHAMDGMYQFFDVQ
jgi:hypothetical protein